MERQSGYLRDLICLRENYPLRKENMLRIGGNARFYAEPRDLNECAEVLECAYKRNLEIAVLGDGTHTLISDDGFDGLILSTKSMKSITLKGSLITAYAGETLDNIINKSIEHHLIGLEKLAGIPGTLGGAIKINAHANSVSISDFIFYIDYLTLDGTFCRTPLYKETFTTDGVTLPDNAIFVAAGLKMTPSQFTAEARLRKETFTELMLVPPATRLASDVFCNPEGYNAADIIRKLDLTGYSGLKAEFSEYNPNMIVTYPGCSSNDVASLILKAEKEAYSRLGIRLRCSLSFIGTFKDMQ